MYNGANLSWEQISSLFSLPRPFLSLSESLSRVVFVADKHDVLPASNQTTSDVEKPKQN